MPENSLIQSASTPKPLPIITAKPVPIKWTNEMSIFASEPFLKAVGDEYGWLGGFDSSGVIRCILPFTIIRKSILRMVRFRVETIRINGDISIEQEKSFLNSVVNYFRRQNVGLIIPATTNTIFRTYPDGAIVAPYGTFLLNTNNDEETLWKNVHAKHRNIIRSAQKNNCTFIHGNEHLNNAYSLLKVTFKKSKMPIIPFEKLQNIASALKENILIALCLNSNLPVSCAILPFSKKSAYYVYGGNTIPPFPGASNYLQWELIRYLKSVGVGSYDFVGVRINPIKGSKQDGLYMFKERFGGLLTEGYIWKYCLKKVPFIVYSLASFFRTRGDIVDAEKRKCNACKK